MTKRKVSTARQPANVELEPAFWSKDYAELYIDQSDGIAEITREEARSIAKMLLEWADDRDQQPRETQE